MGKKHAKYLLVPVPITDGVRSCILGHGVVVFR